MDRITDQDLGGDGEMGGRETGSADGSVWFRMIRPTTEPIRPTLLPILKPADS